MNGKLDTIKMQSRKCGVLNQFYRMPINADNSSCLDLISVTDTGWGDGSEDTRNYLFTLINLQCY